MSYFEIGTTLDGLAALDELTTPLPDMKSSFMPYSRLVNLGNGGTRGVGAPIAIWTFPILEIDQYNQLRTFCPGASAKVFIVTKLDNDTFATFQGTMTVPNEPQNRFYGQRKEYAVQFRNLVLIEGS
jgi:hypothetical protein